MNDFRVGEHVRVREGVTPAHYAGREGFITNIDGTYVYVQGAQSMGTGPASFRPEELEAA